MTTSALSLDRPLVGPLTAVLDQRATAEAERLAFRFLADGEDQEHLLHYGELLRQARIRAGSLVEAGATGKPVLLMESPGLDFIVGLFACWFAGAIAVPAYPPRGNRHRQRLEAILRDSGATLAIGESPAKPIPGVTVLTMEDLATGSPFERDTPHADGPCLLQYTSGSTAKPKGVVLHHHHLRHHLAALGSTLRGLGIRSMLSWLPPYHDMGLILKILFSFDSGQPLTFFSPDHFVQRPVRWLRAISRYRADFSGGPNFAFDLCLRSIRDEELAGLDLSCWNAAPTGAERIRIDTLQRFTRRFAPYGFRPETFLPGYGLAEATLTVTACRSGRFQRISHHPEAGQHVSCGPVVDGSSLRIVDAVSGRTLPAGEIGEIRVKGAGIAAGYWNRPDESAKVFGADGELRTGDRGYLENGELHVVGRIKDLIILGGTNVAPEDVEEDLAGSFPQFTTAAAFAGETAAGEGLVLAIESQRLPEKELADLAVAIRKSIADSLELPIHRIVFVRAGTLPRTTSGKLQRSAARDAFGAGKLVVIFDEAAHAPALPPGGKWLDAVLDAVREVSGRDGGRAEDDLIAFGLSSIEATRLSALLRATTGVEVSLADLFSAPSFGHLAATFEGKTATPPPEIAPGSGRDSGLLTHSQERMGFLHQLEPESAAYHVFGALELEGPLDIAALDRAFAALVARHTILRSRHAMQDGRIVVRLDDSPPLAIERSNGPREPALKAFSLRPFDLANDSPIRALLVACGKKHHILALCAHHIVADGWSVRVLIRDLAAYYATFAGGKQAPPPLAGADYLDYAAWHRRWIESGAADAATFYWKRRLAGHAGVMELATDFSRPAKPSSLGGAVERIMPTGLVERVTAFAKARRVTPFMVQLAAFLLLLRRHGGDDDPVIAVPIANRNHAAAADLVGTLVNTLPFRLTLDPSETFLTLLDRVRDAAFEMQAAQDAPFERIIEAVRPERARDRSPLAQVMFDHQEIPIAEVWHGGLRCRPYLAHRGAVQFDLSLLYFVLSDRQQVVLEYRDDLFKEATAAAMLDRYLATLEAVCREAERPICAIDGLSERDLLHLLAVGQGVERPEFPKQTAPALIAGTCQRLAARTALICGEESLDYAALDSRSSALAASLQAKGVKPGDRIALLLERNLLLPVALLAAWKCGAAYVPLDAANPPERLALVLEDQAPLHVLVSPALVDRLPPTTTSIVLDPEMAAGSAPPEPVSTRPENTAYILYTSGSTGKPKGVVVSHGALANFLLSMQEEPGFAEGQRLLAVTTVSFDISALEIFLPLISGGTVDLIPSGVSRDPAALLSRLEATKPDVMQATPATWRMLIDAGWQGSPATKILCGGEAMDLPLARKLLPLGRELWNLYGPTETTVWSTIWRVPDNPARILIGHPIANTGIHIAGSDGSPLPPGVPGELLISGAGLADGYWQRPELTAERFVPTASTEMPRVYRTGDLARWLGDGSLECLGRSDGQVKVRGFRVELGEIDAALLSHLGIAEAATVLTDDRLIAWYRPTVPGLQASEISAYLRERLPDYMVPAPLISIDRMPLTASGKIDRKALAARPLPETEKPAATNANDPLEMELCQIWADALGCRNVGPHDDFFALGGHSLVAARLVTDATQRTGIAVSLDWLFDRPTPAGMAAQIREKAAPDLAEPRVLPLSRGQGGTPLFWCHTLVDGGMGLLPYRETARLLGDVIDSHGIAEGTHGFETLAAMAAAHVGKIRAVQPRGPYRIAGFCFGGNLAAEIAAQLADAGEEIELLCLLESSPPRATRSYNPWFRLATWRRILSRLPGRVKSLMMRDTEVALRRLKMKQRAAASGMNRLSGKDGIPDIRGILDLDVLDPESQERAMLHWDALHLHEPRLPRAKRIVLIRADDDGWLPRAPTLGWSAPSEIEVHTVPGRHEEFLRHRSAKEVADVMRRVLFK
ncbi:amino acid adenylation domain-containing protein [Luteolibacter arcticus]|uniref:Amino acid adenylation domain-containing protein n=1 Tax=Luteolibacter arcticus TaxID=1581411 RepID=A0ABT3GKQ6_9BACT|nr:non-ribosomal peptide synthetase [Luteolibacter arcticus]MCW1924051.1 amino acid adenylation domain-containing protein [Luteolibacter arcticus]